MPIRLDRAPDFLRLTMSGTLSQEDLRRVAIVAAEVEDASTVIPNRLVDFTEVESLAFGFPDVLLLAAERRNRDYANDFKCALVVASDVQMGYARMYQTLNDNPRIRLQIFTDRTAAEAWLKTPL